MPHTADKDGLTIPDMDVNMDTSPPNDNPGRVHLPPVPLPNASGPQGLDSPPSPPSGTVTTDHSPVDADPGGILEIPPRSQSPLPDDPGPNQPPETLVPPCSNTPTPEATLNQPLLTSAENGAFDLAGVRGDFIFERTCMHWESVPGGEKWVEMVKSYLILEMMVPTKVVSTPSHILFTRN